MASARRHLSLLRSFTPADVLTIGNASCGTIAIFLCLDYLATGTPRFLWTAFVLLPAALVCDVLDGYVARLNKKRQSVLGADLDSLADVITFGVAPAVLAWMWGFRMLPLNFDPDARARVLQLGGVATFVLLLAGAARLARFNIQVNPQPLNPGRPGRKYFVGMPIPAGAGAIAAVVHLVNGEPLQW